MDYYGALGVEKGASQDVIKKAYRQLAVKYHPDKNAGDKTAEEKFKKISEAYAVLSNKEKRQQYDTFGDTGFRQRYSQEDIFRGFDINDILRQFGFGGGAAAGSSSRSSGMGGFESFFQNVGGRSCRQGESRPQPTKGEDVTYVLTVSFEDVLHGSKKTVNLRRNGHDNNISVTIPKGIESGKRLRLSGKGNPSTNGGPVGDLYLKINVEPHPVFIREGKNLLMEKKIPFSQVCLGMDIEVETLDGKVFKVKVPAGTQQESKLRINGHGLPTGPRGGRGDILIKIAVQIPKKLSSEQDKAVKFLSDIGL